ncbi:vWA domain-containing protein [Maribacter sp. R77961]|uniref:vWA domain-containing protein n=1 Tax=Maribacter sp. R77961 TaxID=3093871 RepID=UPI0037C50EF9
MEGQTVLLILFAAITALVVTLFQYHYKTKKRNKITLLLSFLRFIGIFGILLLLINPKFSSTTYTVAQPNLLIVTDNSSSVAESANTIKNLQNTIKNSEELKNRFRFHSYGFGRDVEAFDSLSFKDKQTNIKKSLEVLSKVYARENTALVLLSDGNQTIGEDYSFYRAKENIKIYTVTVGDTTQFEDLSVGPINTNTYAFLDNQFPVETFISYQGTGTVVATVDITFDNKSVYKERLRFSKDFNSKNIKTLIKAASVGKKEIKVTITQLQSERNTANNRRETSIEVIDEKTKIGLVSEILHPDLGALKKAIENNEQRTVQIIQPSKVNTNLDDIDLFIFYQPSPSFNSIIQLAEKKKTNLLFITGTHTDYNYLNAAQNNFKIESGYPDQEVFGVLNKGFSKYDITNFELTNFPPLHSDAGPLSFATQNETLLGTKIKGLDMDTPLFSLFEIDARKMALLTGEGIWKWRLQSYRNSGDFTNFDTFIGNLFRYLSSDKTKDRLNLDYSSRYEGNSMAYISATFFDEAYSFDGNAQLSITIVNDDANKSRTMPMILKNGYFEADLTNLTAGNYNFTVNVKDEDISESGTFVISDFDIEKQFVSSNDDKMKLLAENTGGAHFYPSNYENLLSELISSEQYVPTQKSTENVVSLIDFKILLALVVLAFAIEWFIRKYNGLI